MNTFLAAGIVALITQGPGIRPDRPMTLNFYKTDVSKVFRAISMRSDVNIIYSGGGDLPVTINFSASSADEAVRGTTAAAGLAYRRVGHLYVVAKPDALRQALAPFTSRTRIKTPAASADLAKDLQDLLPLATVAAGEGEIIVNGVPDDVRLAEELINEHVTETDRSARHAEVVSLGVVSVRQVASVIGDLFPRVKVTTLSEGTSGGGTIALIGAEDEVAAAKAKATELDAATPSAASNLMTTTYDLKYASARTCADFLKESAPDVQVTIAPPSQVPDRLLTPLGSYGTSGGGSGGGGATPSTGGGGGGGGTAPAGGGVSAGGGSSSGGGGSTSGGGGGSSGGGGMSITGSNVVNYDRSTRLVLRGRKTEVSSALDLLKSVDQPPQQVVVEVRIVDASPEDIQNLGINYTWQPFQFYDMSKGSSVSSATTNTRPFGLGQISRLPINLTATLDAMTQHSTSKLLASPSMQVLNNEEADFFIGDQLSYPVTTSIGLGAVSTTIQTYNIGIGLNVRPHVNADGKQITLRLNPVVQALTAVTNGLPQTSSREANTIVMVRDGESVVIGGLIRDQDTKTVNEVPLLAQLPIVGQLFRHTSRDHLKSTIIVTVTPHIVKDGQATQ